MGDATVGRQAPQFARGRLVRWLVSPLIAAGLAVSACRGGELLFQAFSLNLQKVAGDGQTGLATFAVNTPPAVEVTDTAGLPVPNAQVTFAVTSGGGSVTGGSATTGSDGIATVGSWTVQLGANTLRATAAGSSGSISFSATGVAAAYTIDVRFLGPPMSPARQAVFTAAAARWGQLIYGDVPDIPVSIPSDTLAKYCTGTKDTPPTLNETIDDIVIFAILDSIDGFGKILARSGPCYIRAPSFHYQPVIGVMYFDTADVANLEGAGKFDEVVTHEMGHVLGYGTIWDPSHDNLLVGPAASGGTDPHFVGTQAIAAFDRIGGTGYTAGAKVPVEATGGPGTQDSHWRKTVFGPELMTGVLSSGVPNPLSVVTVASMGDEFYQVNYAAADPFSVSFAAAMVRALEGVPPIQLGDDVLRMQLRILDQHGRLMRVVRQR